MTSANEGHRYIRKTIEGSAVAGWVVMVIMMIWVTADVVFQAFGSSVPDTINWVEVLNVIAFSLPLAYVTMTKSHITVDLIKVRGKAGRVKEIVVLIMTFAFTAFVAWQLSTLAWRSTLRLESEQLVTRIYLFPAKIALAVSFIGATIILLAQLIGAIRGDKGKQRSVSPAEPV